MLSCKDVTKHTNDYLDRNLPFSKRVALRLHLFICDRCRQYVDQVRKTIATLNSLGGRVSSDPQSVKKTLQHLDKHGLGPKSK